MFRVNIGYDFGGHNYALNYLDKIDLKYDYYFFINSGVIGPIFLLVKLMIKLN